MFAIKVIEMFQARCHLHLKIISRMLVWSILIPRPTVVRETSP
ncbi:MAG: hypothetical protein ACTSVI_02245 [Promethearchaeota archaeon]